MLRKFAAQLVGEAQSRRLGGDDARQHQDHLEDLFDGALIEDDDVDAGLDQILRDGGLEVGEADHEVGFEFQDLIDFGGSEGRDFGLQAGFFGTAGVAGNADDAILLAQQVEGFGGLFGEADDSLGAAAAIGNHAPST